MSAKDRKNIVASVLAKLRNTSKSSGTLFQQVLQQYAMERFLYRISKSKHAQSVVLKGALPLKTIGIPNARPTMDIDMLRTGKLIRRRPPVMPPPYGGGQYITTFSAARPRFESFNIYGPLVTFHWRFRIYRNKAYRWVTPQLGVRGAVWASMLML
jgi:hypothetical protein